MMLDILKPDIIASGMNIFAAWFESVKPSTIPNDTWHVGFILISELTATLLPLNAWAVLLHFLFSAVSDPEVPNLSELALLDFIVSMKMSTCIRKVSRLPSSHWSIVRTNSQRSSRESLGKTLGMKEGMQVACG
jgi:hypothetical protein